MFPTFLCPLPGIGLWLAQWHLNKKRTRRVQFILDRENDRLHREGLKWRMRLERESYIWDLQYNPLRRPAWELRHPERRAISREPYPLEAFYTREQAEEAAAARLAASERRRQRAYESNSGTSTPQPGTPKGSRGGNHSPKGSKLRRPLSPMGHQSPNRKAHPSPSSRRISVRPSASISSLHMQSSPLSPNLPLSPNPHFSHPHHPYQPQSSTPRGHPLEPILSETGDLPHSPSHSESGPSCNRRPRPKPIRPGLHVSIQFSPSSHQHQNPPPSPSVATTIDDTPIHTKPLHRHSQLTIAINSNSSTTPSCPSPTDEPNVNAPSTEPETEDTK